MASSIATVGYIYKKNYVGDKVQNLASRDRAFLSHLAKQGGFTGEDLRQAVQYGNVMGVSASLSAANTALSNTKGVQWAYSRASKYGIILIDAQSMLAAENDPGAFVRLVMNETDSVIDEMGHRLAIDLYGDSTGQVGRRSSASTNVITLTKPDEVKNFSVGMTVEAGTISGTTVTLRTGNTTVTAVDEDAGTVTLASAAAITSFADNDYLFMYGTARTTGTEPNLTGLAGWLPLTAPTGGDSHFGVDRSVDVARLSGNRVSSAVTDIEEKLITLAAKCQRQGGRPRHVYLNPLKWADLSKKLGSKVERDQGGKAEMGFEYISLATPAGVVRVYSDPECPVDRAYMIDHRAWKLRYLGPGAPHLVKDDGLTALRGAASGSGSTGDSIEKRVRFFGQLTCSAPGWNGVCDV